MYIYIKNKAFNTSRVIFRLLPKLRRIKPLKTENYKLKCLLGEMKYIYKTKSLKARYTII